MIAFGEDDTLNSFEERAARYGGPSSEAYLRDGFLKEKPEGRTTFLMRLDQLMASEARVSRDLQSGLCCAVNSRTPTNSYGKLADEFGGRDRASAPQE